MRDNLDALTAAGAKRIAGLSVQSTEYQSEAAARLHLPYPLLSDVDHNLTDSLALPTFEAAGLTLLKRLTVIIDGDHITHTFYPVFPVEEHVSEVVQWLSENPAKQARCLSGNFAVELTGDVQSCVAAFCDRSLARSPKSRGSLRTGGQRLVTHGLRGISVPEW